MIRRNVENYKMLTRVADFASTNVGLFAGSTAAVEVQTSLKTVMGELARLSSARIAAESTLRSARNERDIARGVMKELLAKADQTARALHCQQFRSPGKPTDHALIDGGRAFESEIEPVKAQFVAYGFTPGDVTAAVKPLEIAVLAYAAARAKRSAAIREFNLKMEAAIECLRRLDALVVNTLADNSAAMAEWTMARSVSRATPRKRNVAPVTSEPKAA